MPNFFYLSPSTTKINQILSNSNYISPSNSNYISPSNTDNKSFDSYTYSLICCSFCLVFIYFFFPVIADIIGYMQGIPLNGPNPYLTTYIFGIPYVQKDVIVDNSGLLF